MPAAVEFQHISKRFGAVHANREVSFSIAAGSIHGVIGENGAGKSTLMSILYGYYRPDSGQLLLNGQPQQIRTSQEAIRLGIGMVHQHFMLVENMSVLDNVMLGSEGGFRLAAKRRQVEEKLRQICQQYRLDVDPLAYIQDLSVGVQQRVEILKQIYRSANVLILDEPTAVLTVQESASLFDVLRLFKQQGKTIILITHKLQEILDITDSVTVMRAGTVVGSLATASASKEQLATLMVGRPIQAQLARAPYTPGAAVLEVAGLHLKNQQHVSILKDLHFQIRAGEIVAIAGVSGNGQSELLNMLSGMARPQAGTLTLGDGATARRFDPAHWLDPATARRLHLAHVPEDRHRCGLVLPFAAWETAALGYQRSPRFASAWGWLARAVMRQSTVQMMDA
ncbi:MAG: ATP-binding cassette domain-containing protein, partial [Undibacterium sp.]|nr:ATP-binding cassette domain-containing protein [Undibacterium sp.]